MADRKLIEDYENSLLDLAVSEMLEQYGRELEEKYKDAPDVSPSPESAAKFERELNKAYKRGQLLSFGKKTLKIGRYAITACAAFIIVFTVSVISVDALRFRFLEWLTNIHESHSSLDIEANGGSFDDIIHADYMLPEYELVNYNNDGYLVEIRYSNGTYDINIRVYLNDFAFNTDSENTSLEDVYINDIKGRYQTNTSASTIFWYDGENSYCISTNDAQITKEEFVKIAQSIN